MNVYIFFVFFFLNINSFMFSHNLITINSPKIDSISESDKSNLVYNYGKLIAHNSPFILVALLPRGDEYLVVSKDSDVLMASEQFRVDFSKQLFFMIKNPQAYPQLIDLPLFSSQITQVPVNRQLFSEEN